MRICKKIYFDNAASSYPKPRSVYKKLNRFIKKNGANPGRSGHKLSISASEEVFYARNSVAEYFDTTPENIIFTKNATEALNIAIFSAYKSGCRKFLTTVFEHNSVLRPISFLKEEYGIKTDFFDPYEIDIFSLSDIPDVIISTAASNVTGNILPIEKISDFCLKNNILFIIDASQTAGHPFLYNGDIICTAGHKGLYGIQGGGIIAIKTEYGRNILKPIFFGGTGTDSLQLSPDIVFPESFESGTLSTPAIVSLGAGIDFVIKNEKQIYKKEKKLQKYLYEKMSDMEKIKIFTDIDNSMPIISFVIDGISSEEITSILDKNNICVRGGYHCSPLCHKKIGTVPGGSVRVSIGAFNSKRDIDKLLKIIKKI